MNASTSGYREVDYSGVCNVSRENEGENLTYNVSSDTLKSPNLHDNSFSQDTSPCVVRYDLQASTHETPCVHSARSTPSDGGSRFQCCPSNQIAVEVSCTDLDRAHATIFADDRAEVPGPSCTHDGMKLEYTTADGFLSVGNASPVSPVAASFDLLPSGSLFLSERPAAFRKEWHLPAELLRLIICFADYSESPAWFEGMFDLLYVSRAWKQEAEKYLYKFIEFPAGSILKLCRTILSRPDLARFVHKLKGFCNVPPRTPPQDVTILAEALQSLPNLKELNLFSVSPEAGPPFPLFDCDKDHWILLNCPFQLYRFESNFCWNQAMANFLVSQSKLWRLGLDMSVEKKPIEHPVPATALQHLRCLSVFPGTLSDFAAPPQATNFQLLFADYHPREEKAGAAEIALLGSTLKVVTIARINSENNKHMLSVNGILSSFAASAPHIVFLGLWDYTNDFDSEDNEAILNIISHRFPELRVLVWGPAAAPDELDDDIDDEDFSDAEFSLRTGSVTYGKRLTAYVERLFSASSSLDYFVVGGYREGWIYKRAQDGGPPWTAGPFPPATFMSSCYQYVDPNNPIAFFESRCTVVDPDRFGVRPADLVYDHFLRDVRDSQILPIEYIEKKWEEAWRFTQGWDNTI